MHKLDTTSGHLPYYKQIKEFYKKDIQDGVLAVGDRVDSEMEIQEMYDVSRTAISAYSVVFLRRGAGNDSYYTRYKGNVKA